MATGTKRRSSQLPHGPQKQRRTQPPLTRQEKEGFAATRSIAQRTTSHETQRTAEHRRNDRGEDVVTDLSDVTGLFPADVNAITMIVNAAEKRIMSHVSSLCHKLSLDVKTNECLISDLTKTVATLETNVSNLKVLTLQNSVTIARTKNSGRAGAKTTKNGCSPLQKEIEEKYPNIIAEIPAVFHPELFGRAAGHSICSYMNYFHRAQDDHRMTSRTLAVMTYGLKIHMHRFDLKHGVGKQHTNFRFKIVLSATREALLLTDNVFKEHEKQVIADLVRDEKILPGQLETASRKPAWLHSRLLNKEVMINARKFFECVKSEHNPVPKAEEKRLALHVCRSVFKCVMDMLRLSRERCKVKLYDAGLFIVSDWSKRDSFKPGHTQPILQFVNFTAATISPDAVQECSTKNVDNYEMINNGIFKSLLNSRVEMIVEATYMVTVIVKAPRGSDEDDVTELREIRRHFNILRMAMVFMKAFTHASEEVVLSSHPSMLRNVYRIAILLREIIADYMPESSRPIRAIHESHNDTGDNAAAQTNRSNNSVIGLQRSAGGGRGETPDRSEIGDHDMSGSATRGPGAVGSRSQGSDTNERIPSINLKSLLPGDYENDNTMKKVLRISSDLYDKLKVSENENGTEYLERRASNNITAGEGEDENAFSSLDSDDEDMVGMMDT